MEPDDERDPWEPWDEDYQDWCDEQFNKEMDEARDDN